jgi:carboxymethylenebutenolidase
MTEITVPARDKGSFMAYVAVPEKLPAPAIVVIQEIFGVNAEMRAKCDELAAQGFIAACPDIFWRMEPGVQLTDRTEGEWAKAFDFFKRFDIDKGIEDLKAAVHAMKGYAGSSGKVGCVGYCLGGKLAYLMAARGKPDCAVSYYGVGIQDLLKESSKIRTPLLMHMAEKDQYVPPEAQNAIKEGLKANKMVTIHSYPGADHAFARGGGQHYDEKAAKLANQRTLDFFRGKLDVALAA